MQQLGLLGGLLYRLSEALEMAAHRANTNTEEGSVRNISYHYDAGNDFYKLFLDDTMLYSSGIHGEMLSESGLLATLEGKDFGARERELKRAQYAKIDAIIERAQVRTRGIGQTKAVCRLIRASLVRASLVRRRLSRLSMCVRRSLARHGAGRTGGGSVLAAVSRDLRTYAETGGGREQMAIEAFASALEIIPRTLAENAGLDPVTTLIELRKAHADGQGHAGINVYEGGVGDMKEANVVEPLRVVEQAIQSATETAIMILRIDDVISSKGVPMDDGMGDMGDFHM